MSVKKDVQRFLQHFQTGVEPWLSESFDEEAAKQGYLQVSNHENDSCEIRVSFIQNGVLLRVLDHDMYCPTYAVFATCLLASLRAVDNEDVQEFASLVEAFEPADFI